MSQITKYASYHTAISSGYTNPTNGFADDGAYATGAPNKNSEISAYWGFPGFTSLEIPDGSQINSVKVEIQFKVSTASSVATQYLQSFLNTTGIDVEQTDASEPTTDTLLSHSVTSGVSLSDLRIDDTVRARTRSRRGNSNTAVTFSIDYVSITVDYTEPTQTNVDVYQVTETNTAQTIGKSKSVALAQAVETNECFAITKQVISKYIDLLGAFGCGANVITDPTFQSGIGNFIGYSASLSHYTIDSDTINRTQLLKVTATGTANVSADAEPITLTQGKKYRLRARVYIPSSNTTGNQLIFRSYVSGYGTQIFATVAAIDTWVEVDTEFVAGGTFDYLGTRLRFNTSESGITVGDKYYLDNVYCEEVLNEIAQPITVQLNAPSTNVDLNQASEVDTAQVIANTKSKVFNNAIEIDSAGAIVAQKKTILNQAVETESAQIVLPVKRITVNQSPETDTTQAIASVKSKAFNNAVETDSAGAIAIQKKAILNQAADTESAQIISSIKRKGVNQSSETDTAQIITVQQSSLPIEITVNQAFESDVALNLSANKIKSLSLASEADVSQLINQQKFKNLTGSSEIDLAQSITLFQQGIIIVDVNTVFENNFAQIIGKQKRGIVNQSIEVEAAQVIKIAKRILVAQAIEIDTAQLIDKVKLIGIFSAVEADAGLQIQITKKRTLAQSIETDFSQPLSITGIKYIQLLQAIENNTPLPILISKAKLLSIAEEVEFAVQLETILKRYNISFAEESDLANTIIWRHAQVIQLLQTFELDTAQHIAFRKFNADLLDENSIKTTITDYLLTGKVNDYAESFITEYLINSKTSAYPEITISEEIIRGIIKDR